MSLDSSLHAQMPGEGRGEPEALSNALADVASLYSQSLADHGSSAKSVGWRDIDSQRLRFKKLSEVLDQRVDSAAITVNDLGCGYAAMFHFLDAVPEVQLAGYFGYDISDEMLAAAAKFAADSRAVFLKSERVTRAADYSFVSGTFNVKMKATDAIWTEYIQEALLNLAAHSTKGFAFNLLTTYVDWRQDNLYYGDPFHFFDFCKRHISRYVSLIHDYPLYEWTILVRHEGAVG